MQWAFPGIVSFSERPLQAAVFGRILFASPGFVFALTPFVQLIFLGTIGEYIGAIFDEVKARPHYLVEEK